MKLDLDKINVFEFEIGMTEVRKLLDTSFDEMPEELINVFDNAQGHVFTNESEHSWIVIKITK